ncbi:MAG: hypothetical protein AB7F59_09665 [Bdellovibrionales bacterium]
MRILVILLLICTSLPALALKHGDTSFQKWMFILPKFQPLNLGEAQSKVKEIDAIVMREFVLEKTKEIKEFQNKLSELSNWKNRHINECGTDTNCIKTVHQHYDRDFSSYSKIVAGAEKALMNPAPDRQDTIEILKAISGLRIADEIISLIKSSANEEIVGVKTRYHVHAIGLEYVELEIQTFNNSVLKSRNLYISMNMPLGDHVRKAYESEAEYSERKRRAEMRDSYTSYRDRILEDGFNSSDSVLGIQKTVLLNSIDQDTTKYERKDYSQMPNFHGLITKTINHVNLRFIPTQSLEVGEQKRFNLGVEISVSH